MRHNFSLWFSEHLACVYIFILVYRMLPLVILPSQRPTFIHAQSRFFLPSVESEQLLTKLRCHSLSAGKLMDRKQALWTKLLDRFQSWSRYIHIIAHLNFGERYLYILLYIVCGFAYGYMSQCKTLNNFHGLPLVCENSENQVPQNLDLCG